ncbi:MAG: hypothetical protein QJR05_04555 [Thermoanaerobacterium sp.]|nr:hypothetical protein [Thermoanaerobacterium sp.]
MDKHSKELDEFFEQLAEFLDADPCDVEFNTNNFRLNLYGSDDLYEIIDIVKDMYTIVPIGKGYAFEV